MYSSATSQRVHREQEVEFTSTECSCSASAYRAEEGELVVSEKKNKN